MKRKPIKPGMCFTDNQGFTFETVKVADGRNRLEGRFWWCKGTSEILGEWIYPENFIVNGVYKNNVKGSIKHANGKRSQVEA